VIRPLAGKVRLSGLVVENPEGFATDSAIKLGNLAVDMDIRSATTDKVVIHRILIDGPEITFEQPLTGKNNFMAILDNVEKASPQPTGEEPEEAEEPETEDTSTKKVVIEEVVIRNGLIKLSTPLLKGIAAPIPLPEIRLTGIGEEGDGASIAESISMVFGAILKSSITAVSASMGAIGDGLKAVGGAATDTAKAVTGVATDTAMAATDAAADTAKAVTGAATESAKAATDSAAKAVSAGGAMAADGAKRVGGAVSGGAKAATAGVKKLTGGLGGLLKGGDETEETPTAVDE